MLFQNIKKIPYRTGKCRAVGRYRYYGSVDPDCKKRSSCTTDPDTLPVTFGNDGDVVVLDVFIEARTQQLLHTRPASVSRERKIVKIIAT